VCFSGAGRVYLVWRALWRALKFPVRCRGTRYVIGAFRATLGIDYPQVCCMHTHVLATKLGVRYTVSEVAPCAILLPGGIVKYLFNLYYSLAALVYNYTQCHAVVNAEDGNHSPVLSGSERQTRQAAVILTLNAIAECFCAGIKSGQRKSYTLLSMGVSRLVETPHLKSLSLGARRPVEGVVYIRRARDSTRGRRRSWFIRTPPHGLGTDKPGARVYFLAPGAW
jgi:hypothetical protein